MVLFKKKTILFQGFRGGPTFSRVGFTISKGVPMLISIETHITCDFLRRESGSLITLWIRAWSGSNLFDILTIFLKDFVFKKVIFEKISGQQKA